MSTTGRKMKQNNGLRELVRAAEAHFAKKERVLPWRGPQADPYRIFISEIMLQQTQVERVIPKFTSFIAQFPSWEALARAPLTDVLRAWTGLGYNRRAKHLHEAARVVCGRFGGRLPEDAALIEELPGVGHYTARAVAAFAFGKSDAFIETNIRTVFIRHCFPSRRKVRDAEILPLVALSAQGKDARRWYAALMDYGSHLKRLGVRLNARSASYVKQKAFKGSTRELRGALVRLVLKEEQVSLMHAAKSLERTLEDVQRETRKLHKEGLLRLRGRMISANL